MTATQASATWINCQREMPPADVWVEVLYADGVVASAKRAGIGSGLFIMEGGMYRYVDPMFWRHKPNPDVRR